VIAVFATIDDGLRIVPRFLRAYPWQSLGFLIVYAVTSAASASGLLHLPLPAWMAGQMSVWLFGTLGTLLLAPVWTALYRFAILNDTDRCWWQPDFRTRRVAGVLTALAVVGLIGAAPFAAGLDILPRLGARRMMVIAAVGVAVAVRLGAIWLSTRLAIAPAMAATGTKSEALDISFDYTGGATMRVFAIRTLVYLPLIVTMGAFALALQMFQVGLPVDQVNMLTIANVIVSTLFTACTELIDGAVMARTAVALVRAHRARKRAAAEDD